MSIIIPNYLKEGDKIGICCPASQLKLETIQSMLTQLEFWGFEVVVGKTIGTSFNNFSGTDQERLDDFQTMLDDDEIKAILFGRGGYGFIRIIDHVDFTKFVANPKWLLGFSDITILHNHVHTHFGIATLHGHMSGGYLPEEFDNESTMSIYHGLMGLKSCVYTIPTKNIGTPKVTCHGQLIGGNLAVLVNLIGTPSDIDTKGKILVLEDVGEQKYNIDRMMYQLLRSGKLDHLAGLIVGSFTDSKEQNTPFGQNEYEIIWDLVAAFDYPVCFGFPVGHQPKNLTLKFGVEHTLNILADKIELIEHRIM
jgi:muramoyltetrapeptide carboxypeptidase